MIRSDFVRIWRAWDARPKAELETNRMVDADIRLAAALGMSHIQVRSRLATARRDGLSYEDAYDLVTS